MTPKLKNELKGPCCDRTIKIDSEKSFSTTGDQAYFLGDISLRLQGTLSIRCDCTWSFQGTLKAFDDLYDANKSNRSIIKEFLTTILRNIPGKEYWIEIRGSKSITESGRLR